MKNSHSSFSLLFSGLLLSACTVSVESPERLNTPAFNMFIRGTRLGGIYPLRSTEQALEGCFVWVGDETRGWHTLVYDGSWKSSGGTALASSDIEILSTASLFVSSQRLPCETLLPNTRCVDVENCVFSMHNGQRSSTNPNAVVFDQPSGCTIDGELSLDDYQCEATPVAIEACPHALTGCSDTRCDTGANDIGAAPKVARCGL